MLSSRIKKQFRQSMKSLSALGSSSSTGIRSSLMSPLTSVFLLNFVLGFAIVQFIYWGSKGFNMPIILFILVGFISAFFSKNMLIILLIALAFANLFHFGTMASDTYGGPRINNWFGRREGMSTNEDDESGNDSKETEDESDDGKSKPLEGKKGKKGEMGPAASATSTKGAAGSKKTTGPTAAAAAKKGPASASSGGKKSSSLLDSIDIDDPEKFMRDMEEMQPAMERAEKFMQIAQPFMSAAEPFLSTVQSFRGSSPAPASSK